MFICVLRCESACVHTGGAKATNIGSVHMLCSPKLSSTDFFVCFFFHLMEPTPVFFYDYGSLKLSSLYVIIIFLLNF